MAVEHGRLGERCVEHPAVSALLPERAALTLLLCCALRGWDVVSPYGMLAVSRHAGAQVDGLAVLIGGLAGDLAMSSALRHTMTLLLWPRLVYYGMHAVALATFLGRLAPGVPYTVSVCTAGVFIVESGYRCGLWRGALVGLTVCGCAFGARFAGGWPLSPTDLLVFGVGPCALGVVMRRHLARQVAIAQREALDQRQADVTAAVLQTRSDLQIGAGGQIADRLQGAFFGLSLAGIGGCTAYRARLAGRKAAAAEQVRAGAGYLGDVLREHSAAARSEEPCTDRHHFFDLSVPDGQVVLTRAQATRLRGRLVLLDLHGRVQVRVVRRDAVGGPTLQLDGRLITLPAPEGGHRLHLAPAGFVAAALLLLSMSDGVYQRVPVAITLPFAVITVGLGRRAHRLLATGWPGAEIAVALAATIPLGLAFIAALLGGRSVAPTASGGQRYLLPLVPAMSAWGIIVGGVWGQLPRSRQRLVLSTGLGALTGGLVTASFIRGAGDDAAALLATVPADMFYPIVALIGTIRLAGRFRSAERQVAGAVQDRVSEQIAEAVALTRRQEITMYQDGITHARALLAQAPAGPEHDLAARESDAAASALTGLIGAFQAAETLVMADAISATAGRCVTAVMSVTDAVPVPDALGGAVAASR